MTLGAHVRLERALASCLQPLTGPRATGSALAVATTDGVTLKANTYGVPVVLSPGGGVAGIDYGRLLKVTADTALVKDTPTAVPVQSMTGGKRMNLPAGTRIIWDPPVEGLEAMAEVAADMTGGDDATGYGCVRRVVMLEELGPQETAKAFWAGAVGAYPAIVIAWESQEPWQRLGKGTETSDYRFRLFVVVSTQAGYSQRANEGKAILGYLEEFLVDRCSVDGEVFTSPPCVIEQGGRLGIAASSFVYFLQVKLRFTTRLRETRTFAPWLTSREVLPTPPTAAYPSPEQAVVVVDQTHGMDPANPS